MPSYEFVREDTGESTSIYYPIKDAPKVGAIVEYDGVKWKRVFALPEAVTTGLKPIDPNSQKQFREKTGRMKGTIGDLWATSEELSKRRAERNGGVDPVKEKYYADFKRERRGTPHPNQLAEQQRKAKQALEKGLKELGLS